MSDAELAFFNWRRTLNPVLQRTIDAALLSGRIDLLLWFWAATFEHGTHRPLNVMLAESC